MDLLILLVERRLQLVSRAEIVEPAVGQGRVRRRREPVSTRPSARYGRPCTIPLRPRCSSRQCRARGTASSRQLRLFQPRQTAPAAQAPASAVPVPSSSVPIVTAAEMVAPPPPALPYRTRAGSALTFTQSRRGRLIAGVHRRRARRPRDLGLATHAHRRGSERAAVQGANFYRDEVERGRVRKGIDYYNRAIALDPNALDAYNGLALGVDISLRPARVAARRHAARPRGGGGGVAARRIPGPRRMLPLGVIKLQYDWDFAGADREFARAMGARAGSSIPWARDPGELAAVWRRDRLTTPQVETQRAVDEDASSER